MRCENCGWDRNPEGSLKCEKCGARLGKSSGGTGMQQSAQNFSDNDFDLKKTRKGCPECGYPIRSSEDQCPQCGNTLSAGKTVPDEPLPQPKNPSLAKQEFKGTVIKTGEPENENDERTNESKIDPSEGKKVVGFLVTYSHTHLGEFFPLYAGRNFVGKDASMNVQIKGDDAVSSKHLSILYRVVDKKFKFKDEQSSNGTFINNELIDEGELLNNDIISIGNTKLVFMVIPTIEKN